MNGSRLLGWRRTVPTEVAVLALILLVAALCCVLAALFPMSDRAPIGLALALTPTGFVAAIGLLALGSRTPRWAVHACVVYVTVAAGLLISQSATIGGVMMTAWTFAWLSVFIAIFFSRRAIRLHVAGMTLCFGIAVLVVDLPGTPVAFAMVSLSMWTAALTLGSLSERLRAQADSDPLTGLANRSGFAKAATRELALASRTGNPLTLALLDLDGFKRVNDEHGHAAGDRLLAELARAWEGVLRPGDLVARFGGDEFVALFPATREADAHVALARMRAAHAAAWSAGVVAWEPRETLDACLKRADARLYAAKGAAKRAAASGRAREIDALAG